MKFKILALASLSLVGSLHAGITLSVTLGAALDSGGNAVPDGTLYALVIDTDGSNSFAGGFGTNESMVSQAGANAAFFTGQSVTLGGLWGGDTIFAIGGFNGDGGGGNKGFIQDSINLELGINGVAGGQKTAIFYFPGATYSVNASENKVGSEVGGMNSNPQTGDFTQTMLMPSEGTLDYGAFTASSGGTTPNFQALKLTSVPEPSSAFLASLGVLGLLRRRRN
jgi:PEP-CTERM motif